MIAGGGGGHGAGIEKGQKHGRFGLAIRLTQAGEIPPLLEFVGRDGRAGQEKKRGLQYSNLLTSGWASSA